MSLISVLGGINLKKCFNSVFPFINRLGLLAILNLIFNICLQVLLMGISTESRSLFLTESNLF